MPQYFIRLWISTYVFSLFRARFGSFQCLAVCKIIHTAHTPTANLHGCAHKHQEEYTYPRILSKFTIRSCIELTAEIHQSIWLVVPLVLLNEQNDTRNTHRFRMHIKTMCIKYEFERLNESEDGNIVIKIRIWSFSTAQPIKSSLRFIHFWNFHCRIAGFGMVLHSCSI